MIQQGIRKTHYGAHILVDNTNTLTMTLGHTTYVLPESVLVILSTFFQESPAMLDRIDAAEDRVARLLGIGAYSPAEQARERRLKKQ